MVGTPLPSVLGLHGRGRRSDRAGGPLVPGVPDGPGRSNWQLKQACSKRAGLNWKERFLLKKKEGSTPDRALNEGWPSDCLIGVWCAPKFGLPLGTFGSVRLSLSARINPTF